MRKKFTDISQHLNKWANFSFAEQYLPPLVCPTCLKGELLFDAEKFHFTETQESKNSHSHPQFDHEWIRYNFIGALACNNSTCQEIVTMIGSGRIVDGSYFDEESESYQHESQREFSPLYFNPPLQLFPIPATCPKPVRDEVEKSFALFFADKSASANRVRSTVELILDEKKVKHIKVVTEKSGIKKRKTLTLHPRIKEFGIRQPDIAEHLLAIKWIGNPASHAEKIYERDLLEAYELLEYSLVKLYDDRERRVKEITKQINKRKKPRSYGSRPAF